MIIQETTPAMHANNPFNGRVQSYGATVTAGDGYYAQNTNTFAGDSSVQQVQPKAQDIYMHGGVQDRNY